MNPFVTPESLQASIGELGFRVTQSGTRSSLAFVRPSPNPHLFEWIIIETAGRSSEAIAASVAVSVTQFVPFFHLMELKPLVEIAEDSFRSVSILTGSSVARAWLDRLRNAAPQHLEELVTACGATLLERTQSARHAADEYFTCFALQNVSLHEYLCLKAQQCAELIRDATRLSQFPGVLHIFGGDQVYIGACATILSFERDVETSGNSFVGQNPLDNQELLWRIQLLVDRLLSTRI